MTKGVHFCTLCKTEKPFDAFYKDKSKPWGYHQNCKVCQIARVKRKRKTDPVWRDRQLEISRAWRVNNPERFFWSVRNATLKAKYGITHDQYIALFRKQGNKCAVCGRTKSGGNGYMAVDHDHRTGKVRGILCQPCNTSIGKMNEDPQLLRKLANYVEKGGVLSVS